MNQPERTKMIEEYGGGYALLTEALAEIPGEAREFKPAPDAWSVHEIIIHMADSEIMGATRVRMLIAQPGTTLMSYDDNKWSKALVYPKQNMEDALQLFRLTRQTTYHLLKALPDPVFMQSVIHPEYGYPEYGDVYTLEKWLRIYTRHVRDHVEQLHQNHRAWKEQKK
jgi:DinB family protein